jgi:hypothetical protein
MVEDHPLRTVGDCLKRVRADRQRAGQAEPDLFVHLPNDFMHPYFFYLRPIGWEWHDTLSEGEFRSIIGLDGTPRPVLLARPLFDRLWQPYGQRGSRSPERVSVKNVLLLLPGPYAGCADER